MKDEYDGRVPHWFYGLMAKTYAVKLDGSKVKKDKGLSKHIIKNN